MYVLVLLVSAGVNLGDDDEATRAVITRGFDIPDGDPPAPRKSGALIALGTTALLKWCK